MKCFLSFQILLTSMHKYMPRVWIIRCDDLSSIRDLYSHPSAYFNFPETEFIAVTAYQVTVYFFTSLHIHCVAIISQLPSTKHQLIFPPNQARAYWLQFRTARHQRRRG